MIEERTRVPKVYEYLVLSRFEMNVKAKITRLRFRKFHRIRVRVRRTNWFSPLVSMDVDSTPQYPVDTVTATAMQDSGAGDAPANLDEYMNEALRESGGAGKKSSGRGRGPNGERLKVRAVIVKRSNTGPSGGDRSSGGRGGGRGASVPKKVRGAMS